MQRQTDGMTLIEVLIALAIIAIALTAVIKAASQNIRGTNYVENKMIALWVAQEVMREAQVGLISLPQGEEGETAAMNMLGHDWYWRASEQSSANARIKKLRVQVYEREPQDEHTQSLIDLDGYRYHAAS